MIGLTDGLEVDDGLASPASGASRPGVHPRHGRFEEPRAYFKTPQFYERVPLKFEDCPRCKVSLPIVTPGYILMQCPNCSFEIPRFAHVERTAFVGGKMVGEAKSC
jgi:hypothetical protein